uniref:Transmembrane protein n=1 Tax=Kalanchoe fedtschenkoi TaxID=63787 RepID=A0A7N0T821_KALFE
MSFISLLLDQISPGKTMADWGAVFVSLVLFVLLSPGLLFQIPGRVRFIEFGTFQTSGPALLVHSFLYLVLIYFSLLVVGVHMYIGI